MIALHLKSHKSGEIALLERGLSGNLYGHPLLVHYKGFSAKTG
jgi:hypothetical protein